MIKLKNILKEIQKKNESFLHPGKKGGAVGPKVTPAQITKHQRNLIKTIDDLKKNFPLYKAAKDVGDKKKLEIYRKIALDLTKKKQEFEIQLDNAVGNLYQDAELEVE